MPDAVEYHIVANTHQTKISGDSVLHLVNRYYYSRYKFFLCKKALLHNCRDNIASFLSARLSARSKVVGARAFRPWESSFHELSHLGFSGFIKIAFDIHKDNYLFFQHQPWKRLSEQQAMIGRRRRQLDSVADNLILNQIIIASWLKWFTFRFNKEIITFKFNKTSHQKIKVDLNNITTTSFFIRETSNQKTST